MQVLSVVSQQACRVSCPDACVSSMCSEHCQVQTIQFAIRDKKDIFYFEDTQIRQRAQKLLIAIGTSRCDDPLMLNYAWVGSIHF